MNDEWISRLKKVRKIYAHKSCPDGTMSALVCTAAYQAIGLSPDIEFIQYNTKKIDELKVDTGLLFVDIAPPGDNWEKWKKVSPIVLDHHATREHVTKGLGGFYGYPEDSGASLAFKHVMAPLLVGTESASILTKWAKFVVLARIRDTWQQDHPEWFDAAAFGQGTQFFGSKPLLEDLAEGRLNLDKVLEIGRLLYKKIERKSEFVSKSSYYTTMVLDREYKLGFCNSSEGITSEIGHYMLNSEGCDLAAIYFIFVQDGGLKAVVSLRSTDALNARAICERFGGGGHPRAAGFRTNGAYPITHIVDKVKEAIATVHNKS
jgi:oligoribonuclease NrnB/cAMP/cGMP phosphodiesterase (DHH superfamily)